jgi:hypothetical protein
MTQHCRRRNERTSREEQVRVTESGRLYVNEHLAPDRRSDIHVLEVEPTTERIQYECLHWGPCTAGVAFDL